MNRRRQPPPTPDNVTPELIDDREFKDRLELLPSDWTSRDVRPATVIAALMQQAPGDGYQDSLEDTAVLDEAIAYTLDCLTAEDIYILNAIQHEGITYEELAKRLGVSRTQGWRLHRRSLERLRTLLLNHPPVRERLGMEPTWNAAAMRELIMIAGYDEDWPEGSPESTLEQYAATVAWRIGSAVHSLNVLGLENDAVKALTMGAEHSVEYLRSVGVWNLLDMHTLLCSKQNDYGHGNILLFGMFGVMVRASDKAERLKNLTRPSFVTGLGGVKPANESLIDTFRDVVGYAVIARMLKAETFELELEGTTSTESESAA